MGASNSYYKAIYYLKKALSDGVWRNGDRMPTVRQLARLAHVSASAMNKALATLNKKQLITVRRRAGIFAGSIKLADPSAADEKLAWKRVANLIERDIIDKKYLPDTLLPGVGELASSYGVCFRTARAALQYLTECNVIVPFRRKFKVAQIALRGSRPTILLISGRSAQGTFFVSARNEEFLRTVERECSSREVILDLCVAYNDKGSLVFTDSNGVTSTNLEHLDTVIGCILWIETIPHVERLITILRSKGKPTAILDETGTFSAKVNLQKTDKIAVFSVGYMPSVGAAVARFLLKSGHRSIAYISPYNWNLWSINRYKGLKETFEECGLTDAVLCCSYDEPFDEWNFIGPDGKDLSAYIPFSEEFKNIIKNLDGFIKKAPSNYYVELMGIRTYLTDIQRRKFLGSYLLPLFDKAFSKKDITAWVTCYDGIAYLALDYLAQKKVHVPRELSVIGFDDYFDSFRKNLTTVNFNVSTIALRMLAYLFNPRNLPVNTEVPVSIIQRGTTSSVASTKHLS